MAKTRSTSTPKKKPAGKTPPRKKTAARKPTTRKKSAAKEPSTKPSPKKSASKKKTTKKSTARKTTRKKKTGKKKAGTTATSTRKKSPTKKPTTKKSTKTKPAKVAPEDMTLEQAMDLDWTEPKLRRVKSGLSRKDLTYYREMLLEKRAELLGDVRGMESSRNASLGDIAHMPLHMADVGSDMFDQEFTLGLIESERRLLVEINEALRRMADKTYGVCMASGRPIGKDRLEFKPWAKYCIEVARLREKRGL